MPASQTSDEAFTVAAEAFVGAAGGWAEAVHAALAALLDHLAAAPARSRSCLTETDPAAADRRDRNLERFAELLEPGYELADPRPPAIAAEAVTGGIFELIRSYALEDRVDALPYALPVATVIALTPFVGSDRAERTAARPAPASAGR